MARDGKPELNPQEDVLIAGSLHFIPFEHPIVESKVKALLSSRFPGDQVDTFVAENIREALGIYLALSYVGGGNREALKTKMSDIRKLSDKLSDALCELDSDEYSMLVMAIYSGRNPDGAVRLGESKWDETTTSALISRFDKPLFTILLALLFRGASSLEKALYGTAQNSRRPLRMLIRILLSGWLRCGLPLPKWIYGADSNDPMEKDQDVFCEMIHLILDDMVTADDAGMRPRPTTGQIDRALHSILVTENKIRKKIPAKAGNSHL